MKAMLNRWSRAAAGLAAAMSFALVALVLPASPAHALPSGTSWSGSWNYYATNAIQYAATLPGVKLTGYATDNGGTRTTVGTIQDVGDDNRCARVQLYAAGVGYIADKTTCGNGSYLTYGTGAFHEGLLVVVYRMLPNGSTTSDKSFHIYIPPSTGDAELRTVGTGTSWSYYTAEAFQYQIVRPGVKLTGYGTTQTGDKRSSLNTVSKTATGGGCVTGKARAGGGTAISGSTCAAGGYTTFGTFAFTGFIEAEACYRPTSGTNRCTTVNVPEPR